MKNILRLVKKNKNFFMPLITAFWLSFLFLPFKGIRASIFLFIIMAFVISAFKFFSTFIKKRHLPAIDFKRYITFDSRFLFLLLILLMTIPFFAEDYIIDVVVISGIYIILALALNIVVGFAGLLNLGFVAFYAIGAYSYALINTKLGFGFWSAMPLSVSIATISGLLLAIPSSRLKGDYLALVTLGFGEIVRLILNNWDSVTKGPNGISGIMPPYFFSISLEKLSYYYYLVLFFVITSIFIIRRVHNSKIGRAWLSLREDEIASSAMGINTTMYKLYSFAFGAFWAGLAGCLFSAKMRFVSPESFTFTESVLILCMVILGGLGSIAGVIIGALILVFLPEVLRDIQTFRMLALGAGIVILMVFRPQGLFGGKSVSF